MSEEKRKQPRVMVRILVDYESSGTFLYDYSNDLSEGGIFIETENPLDEGSSIKLRFTLPDVDKVFDVEGKVVWLREAETMADGKKKGMGIEFAGLSDEQKNQIQDYIDSVMN